MPQTRHLGSVMVHARSCVTPEAYVASYENRASWGGPFGSDASYNRMATTASVAAEIPAAYASIRAGVP
jgi:hypothetical protein